METQHTPDITTGFIQMVEAFKAKPELEAKINDLQHQVDYANNTLSDNERRIQELEARLAASAQDKERLTRERDEAMFRSLELEEKTSAVSDLVAKLEGLVRPEPVAKVEAPVEQSVEQGTMEQGSVTRSVDGGYETKIGEHSIFEPGRGEPHDSNVERFRPEYNGQRQSGAGNMESAHTPNWDSPTKEQQNSSEGSGNASETVASSYVSEPPRHENHGKPYDQKPWWVNDNDWRAQGGQGPHEGGSWQAPWEQRA